MSMVLTAILLKIQAFTDAPPCRLLKYLPTFRRIVVPPCPMTTLPWRGRYYDHSKPDDKM